MLKRILLSLVLAASVGGALAACNNSSTPSPTESPAAASPAESPAAASPAESPAAASPAESLEASPASS
jgi:hypothetical protein